jgi:hypothetical protein
MMEAGRRRGMSIGWTNPRDLKGREEKGRKAIKVRKG